MSLKTLHSRRTCLIVQGVWRVEHCGCCSCLSIKECVSLLWPIRNRVIVTCSFRDFRKAGRHSPKKGLTWNSLLLEFLFLRCCHFLWRKLFILGFRSVYGMLYLSGVKSKADFATASALWFPLTSWRSREEFISEDLQWTSTIGHFNVGKRVKTYSHQIYADRIGPA